jgi:hypothetical protein
MSSSKDKDTTSYVSRNSQSQFATRRSYQGNIYFMFQVPTTGRRFLFYLISMAMEERTIVTLHLQTCVHLPTRRIFLLVYPQGSLDSYGSSHWNASLPGGGQ